MTDPSTDDELARLQARAYGPNPDLSAEELRRLQELQNPPRVAETPAFVASEVRSDETPTDDTPAESSEAPTRAAPSRRTRVPRTAGWIAAVVAAGVAGGFIGASFADDDPTIVARLSPDPGAVAPVGLDDPSFPEPVVYDEYYDVAVVTFTNPQGDDALRCIAVRGEDGQASGGCSSGSLNPMTQITVRDDSPEALRERHAEGTILRLTQVGDRIEVRASDS